MKNYEICSQRNCAEYPFSREDVIKCAVRMERKALRSCMVVILYQRAMTRLVSINPNRTCVYLVLKKQYYALEN